MKPRKCRRRRRSEPEPAEEKKILHFNREIFIAADRKKIRENFQLVQSFVSRTLSIVKI